MAKDITQPSTSGRSVQPRQVAAGVAAVIVIVLALANLQRVNIHFVVATSRLPLIILVALAMLLGVVLGYVAGRERR